jgi:hypothetical protein
VETLFQFTIIIWNGILRAIGIENNTINNGFELLSLEEHNKSIGMLYAFNRKVIK